MNLHVLVVEAALLGPEPVARVDAAPLLAALVPEGFVPEVRWTGAGALDLGGVLDGEDAAARAARRALLCEYLDDVAPSGRPVVVVAPDRHASGEPCAAALVEAAAAWWPDGTVRTSSLLLSRPADDVLRGLAGAPPRQPDDALCLVDATGDDGAAASLPAAILRNYTRAVLGHGERSLGTQSVWDGAERASRAALLLASSGQWLRADLSLAQVRAALAPGGELFELLTRPQPVVEVLARALFSGDGGGA
ncbi:MAG: hypothetical protein R2939_12835 [Kofleriaceae bacterium]